MQLMKNFAWVLQEGDPVLEQVLAFELGISPLVARLLVNRGVHTPEDAVFLLDPRPERLYSPWLMADMDRAVERLRRAIRLGERVLVYGDYDCDGITGTALLVRVLAALGCRVEYYVPHRVEEGYGLNREALDWAAARGVTLVVTVDCGIQATSLAARAREAGLDIIVTDHHEIAGPLPEAAAVVNPRRPDCSYPFKELAGVGVAYKLAQALTEGAGGPDPLCLAFVCLGTVADQVPLTGENHLLARLGLEELRRTGQTGLRALLCSTRLGERTLSVRDVAFVLGPRLNAAGRVGDPRAAVELLLCDDEATAARLTERLEILNRERQYLEARIFAEVLARLQTEPDLARDPVLVLGGKGWHPGVIGIVAARLVEYFYRPVLLVALEGDRGRGSGRSVPGFHLFRALVRCREWLTEFGGHAGAAGFILPAGNVEPLRRAMADLALEGEALAGVPRLEVDAVLRLEELRADLVRACAALAPFGYGNPEPLLVCSGVDIVDGRRAGRNGAHLKMRVRQGSRTVEAIGFGLGDRLDEVGGPHDLVFTPGLGRTPGREQVELRVIDFAPAGRENLHPGNGFRLPEALFRSDFVLRRMQELRNPVSVSTAPEACMAVGWAVPGVGPREIVDRREWPHRPSLVVRLVGTEASCAVVAGGAHEALFWWRYLRKHAGVPGAGLYHPRLPLRRGTPAVTTPDGLALLEERPAQVLLCYLPFEPREWEAVLRAATGSTLVLVWNGADLRRSADELAALAPGREALGLLYRLLREPRHGATFSARELAVRLREQGLARAGPHTVEVGLRILSELELVRYTWERIGVVACRHLQNKTRRDLNDSFTYRWAQQWKVAVQRWQEILWQQRGWPEC